MGRCWGGNDLPRVLGADWSGRGKEARQEKATAVELHVDQHMSKGFISKEKMDIDEEEATGFSEGDRTHEEKKLSGDGPYTACTMINRCSVTTLLLQAFRHKML